MKRLTMVMAIVSLLVGMLAVPALADAPVEFTDTAEREEVDPCTGDTMTVAYSWTVLQHDHRNNFVEVVDSHFETSTGYVATGHENIVVNKNNQITVFNWVAVNDDTGARFRVKGRIIVDLGTGEPNVLRIEAKCTGAGAHE